MSGKAQKSLNAYADCRLVIITTLYSTEFLGFRVPPYVLEAITVDGYPGMAVWVVGLRVVAALGQAGAVVLVVAALAVVGRDGVGEWIKSWQTRGRH